VFKRVGAVNRVQVLILSTSHFNQIGEFYFDPLLQQPDMTKTEPHVDPTLDFRRAIIASKKSVTHMAIPAIYYSQFSRQVFLRKPTPSETCPRIGNFHTAFWPFLLIIAQEILMQNITRPAGEDSSEWISIILRLLWLRSRNHSWASNLWEISTITSWFNDDQQDNLQPSEVRGILPHMTIIFLSAKCDSLPTSSFSDGR